MRRIIACITVVTFVAACENSNDPIGGIGGNGGTGAVTQAQASGNWSVTLRRTTTLPCTGGSLPDNQILTTHFDVLTNGTLTTATSTWQNPPTTVVRALSGAIRFTDGFTDLFLFPSATNTSSGMELRGTLTSAGSFSGTLTDPAPGLTPVFSSGGCEYTATGTKTG